MTQSDLHKLLGELHEELVAAHTVDAKNRELLKSLARDIRGIVDAGPEQTPPEHYQGLRARLVDAGYAFEASHPRLTMAVERVIDSLGAAGI
jgi:hypothetical protein